MSKEGQHTMSAEWLPGAGLGLIGSAVAWLLSWRINTAKKDGRTEAAVEAAEDRDEGFRENLRDMRDEWRAGIAEVRTLAMITAKLQASQEVVNTVTAKALDAITSKLDAHQEKLNDHSATLKLVTELLTREQKGRQ
jgi:hypothetical protein